MKNHNLGLKSLVLLLIFGSLWASASPQILVTDEQHGAVLEKIKTVKWASNAYQRIKTRVDQYVAKTQLEPDWMTARLAMNWQTHYTRTITKGSRSVKAEGRAPVPTPRFAGARDWKTDYIAQDLADLKPYNDRDGLIQLVNRKTGKEQWVEPSVTGHAIERINRNLMTLAADAAFVYWITGEVKYAEFAAPVLWTYMRGFSYVKAPYVGEEDKKLRQIIGLTSYEVIHEGIIESLAIAYDFLRDYVASRADIDAALIETGIKRIVDVVISGGKNRGNWNIHQTAKITYGGLAMSPDRHYQDGKGRQYYVDIALNANLPQQLGLLQVIKQGYHQKTAIWGESPGYAFGTTANIIEVASLLSKDANGRKVLEDPMMQRALFAQLRQMYPNGASHGMGDTSYTRISTHALELMLSWAIDTGDSKAAAAFSAVLTAEQAAGKYSREENISLFDLIFYAAELPKPSPTVLTQTPSYFAEPINLVMLQNMPSNGDIHYALGATMFGTQGGHAHTNGLTTELYGAGHVLGIDSGRGTSYWQDDHRHYYQTLPSHNTVIPNGNATYPSWGDGKIAMQVKAVKPAFNEPNNDSNFNYLTAGFNYENPAATQQRTLALVRIDDTTAFYFDVFRSRIKDTNAEQYHDWFYHGMAERVELTQLTLTPSSMLSSKNGNMKGYDYFNNESSVQTAATIHARFPLQIESDKVAMDIWILGAEARTIYKVDAPANRAARHNYPKKYWQRPTPTLMIRQQGEAWDRPFVAVYEPSLQADKVQIKSVQTVTDNTWRVSGSDWQAMLTLNGDELEVAITRQ